MTVDGRGTRTDAVEIADGMHEVVVFIEPLPEPASPIDNTRSSAALVEQFKTETVFYRQLEIAKALVERGDQSVLPLLVPWLDHQDRHVRGNTALVFGGLGDPRGLQVISGILADRSDRPEGQGMSGTSSDGRYHVQQQVAADRYYAAHLLGDLRDPNGVSILVPLLKDKEVDAVVPWALGQIGGPRAVTSLIEALSDDDPSMRVSVIYALEMLKAQEAIPRLRSLLDDHRTSRLGTPVSVSEAARGAIAMIGRR